MKPITLNQSEVRTLLAEGRVEVRREVKPQPPEYINELHGRELSERAPYRLENSEGKICGVGFQDDNDTFYRCLPPRTEVWVRETWARSTKEDSNRAAYRADGKCVGIGGDGCGGWLQIFHGWLFPDVKDKGPSLGRTLYGPWRPSTQMPQKLARLFGRIASVSVEQRESKWEWVYQVERKEN